MDSQRVHDLDQYVSETQSEISDDELRRLYEREVLHRRDTSQFSTNPKILLDNMASI